MIELTDAQKQTILDSFGKILIADVRDGALFVSMGIVKRTTPNPVQLQRYSVLEGLNADQQEAICDLLSETITDTIYRFLEMFEENKPKMRLTVIQNGVEYDMSRVSEKMGSEIACYDEGWIQKYSKIGRFVL